MLFQHYVTLELRILPQFDYLSILVYQYKHLENILPLSAIPSHAV